MGNKKEPNGKVILYTEQGAKIVDAHVSISTEVFGGGAIHDHGVYFKYADIPKDLKYCVVGSAKTVANECALSPMPFLIGEALKYTQTKFFRLIIDLMKLAKFNPFECYAFGTAHFHELRNMAEPFDDGIDYSVFAAEIDAQLYRKYDFTPAMIDFAERRYSYDNGAGSV